MSLFDDLEKYNLSYLAFRLQDDGTRSQVLSVVKGECPCSLLRPLEERMGQVAYNRMNYDVSVSWRAEGFKALKYPLGKSFVKFLERQLTIFKICHVLKSSPCGRNFIKINENNKLLSFHNLVLELDDVAVINRSLVNSGYQIIMRVHMNGQFHVKWQSQ